MKIAIIPTYPIYHDHISHQQWMAKLDRERWIANQFSRLGHESEFWVVSDRESVIVEKDSKTVLRFFQAENKTGKTRYHYSSALCDNARKFNADLHILKGLDGGMGDYLIRHFLIPESKPFAFIIGGTWWTRFVPRASFVLYESSYQKEKLQTGDICSWRKKIPEKQLISLPKLIETDRFKPIPEIKKEWDILSVGRLTPGIKDYSSLGRVSDICKTAVIGGGPALGSLKRKYPNITWLGPIENSKLPEYYNRTRLFIHTSPLDYHPRVIDEAQACGLPVMVFKGRIKSDILPETCGIQLSKQRYSKQISNLLNDHSRLQKMGQNARQHALIHAGPEACMKALETMLIRFESRKTDV